ncbi:MAG: hypothetical protein M0D57_15435 [Sphingobacteriales bacterium JAD_PAG50586_3]|nr:MAG: hypothetical protein M0D57_15435 [Sphingobacteriales bacterium JAD_PAG50586_3]
MKKIFSVLKSKSLLLGIVLMMVSAPAFSQVKMGFCFNVTGDNGAADWLFNTITLDKDKPLKCVVYLPAVIPDLTYVTFKVQYQQADGQPFIDTDSYQLDVKPDWQWFYYNLKFTMPGNYKISLLDNNNALLVDGLLHLLP